MEFLTNYGLFLAKTLTVVVAVLVVVGGIIALRLRQRDGAAGRFKIIELNAQYRDNRAQLEQAILPPKQWRTQQKLREKENKQAEKQPSDAVLRTFVLRFTGDMRASQVASLREEISTILSVARPAQDEVMVCLESGGGLVTAYGLAAAQLARVRAAGIKLTVTIDKVAASGGYMMAAVADHIVAAPFAIVGSIGVVAQIPNIHRLLQRNEVDIELLTAGQYKRTLTILGENTDEGREKFQAQLNDTHDLFKNFLQEYRPNLDLSMVATGEYWFGTTALALGLIDELSTSDAWIEAQFAERRVIDVRKMPVQSLAKRLRGSMEQSVQRVLTRLFDQVRQKSLDPQERL
ncbi:MAG: protease SohB [Halothiobacillus sp. 24-54-40]|jgi:serine protease SohB|nr:MAG: protease SohB [Halothiobacillus sp. 35-54-62]OYZ88263.1 MAG: protease SohB [Halothiobacillus sp. 24-54-40]OZA81325.1 MAG: protease SohB [Halothiobacillus sp. 39-53-45]HQS01931.1 protease SohB [Halothiobacillus sp.]HQS28759.1 protease SohB [Halothiobacillus sp.]